MHREHVCNRLDVGQFVGLAVAWTKNRNTHIGIAFQWKGTSYLYHQRFHKKTALDEFDVGVREIGGSTLVVALAFHRDRQKAIAGFLNSLGQVDPQYPYSLKYDSKAALDENLGKLISDGKGLNCVTFVLAVLLSCKIRLVDAPTWPTDRAKDLKAHDKLLEDLANYPNVTLEDMEEIRKGRGSLRVRPEEAGGAGCYKMVPVKFIQAEPASLYLLKQLSSAAGLHVWDVYPEAN